MRIFDHSIKNRGDTLILTILVGVRIRNIHTKLETSLCVGLGEVKNVILLGEWYIVIHCKYACCVTTKKLISMIP